VYSTLCILCQRWVFSEQTIIRIVAWRTFSFLRLPLPFLLRGKPERHTPLAWHRGLSCGIPVT
jgi:hypothetical protein